MGLTGVLRKVALEVCPLCNKEYGRHSKKKFMKCLYTANYNLYNMSIELAQLRAENIPEAPDKINVHGQGEISTNTKIVVDEHGEAKVNWKKDLKEGQSIATEKPDE